MTLREKWFSSHEFFVGTIISNKKYQYLRLKYKSSFYFFNNKLDYNLAHYFVESEMTKGNVIKFLTDLLMTIFIKKLFYKDTDE